MNPRDSELWLPCMFINTSVFPLRTVLKSQQCLHAARRDKICILYRQLPFVLGGPNGVKFLPTIWLWNSDIRQLKWRQSTQRRIETDSGTNQDRIQIQLINGFLLNTSKDQVWNSFRDMRTSRPPFPTTPKRACILNFRGITSWEEVEIKILSESSNDVC